VSDQIKPDIMKHFPTVTIEYGGQIKKFKKNEEITIMRNNEIMKIKAYEFNKDTDLLGIE
jgi:Fe-S-cluster containining protein